MKKALIVALILALAGGGYYWRQGADARYARQVMDCMYAGSYEPIKDSLCDKAKKELEKPKVQESLPRLGEMMKEAYGEIERVKLKSKGPLEGPGAQVHGKDATKKVFSVTSDKGKFDLTLILDKDNKLLMFVPGKFTPH